MLLRSYTCSIPCLRSSHIWSKLIGLRPCWWELAGVYVAIVVYEMYKNWEKLPLTGYTVRQKWLCSEATVSCCTLQLTDTARIIFHINVPFTSMQWFQPTCLKRANQPRFMQKFMLSMPFCSRCGAFLTTPNPGFRTCKMRILMRFLTLTLS